ncbi:MAG TPA: hypothetical protein VNZ45_00610 [Bacteroidia bacterium]|nr:hypothetical protein [Bacteroidia bacterium]
MNGPQKSYYESGKVKSEATWVNGKAGASKYYDEDGKETK